MKRLYHNAIFYPDEPDELRAMTDGIKQQIGNASALILPHGDARKLYELYRKALGYIPASVKQVIIITPIHSELLEEDDGDIAFEGESGHLSTFYGDITLKSLGLKVQEAYAEEESAAEILLPFIRSAAPDACISVSYAKIQNAADSRRFAQLIKNWQKENPFFIISSNLTGRMRKEEIMEARQSAADCITGCSHLIDAQNKHMIDICASGIIDSFNRTDKGLWHLIGFSENDTITGHGAFYRE